MKIFAIIISYFMLLSINPGFGVLAGEDELMVDPSISSETAVLMDYNTGTILYGKDEHKRMHPASTTKILTALLLMENASLQEEVLVSENAYGTPGSSLYLDKGEVISARNLLYGLMVRSANDGAVAAAEHVSGSVEAFSQKMTERASELGAKNSTFKNPHGLTEEEHLTSAYDLALITREALESPIFRHVVSTYRRTIPWPGNENNRDLINRNQLLRDYEGAIGVKTGYTSKSGQTLVASAERDGQLLIAVVLSGTGDSIFQDASQLLDYGFDNYSVNTVVEKGEVVDELDISGGDRQLKVIAEDELLLPLQDEDTSKQDLTKTVQIMSSLEAPIEAGEEVGTIKVRYQDEEVGQMSLKAGNEVETSFFSHGFIYIAIVSFLTFIIVICLKFMRHRMKNKRKQEKILKEKYFNKY